MYINELTVKNLKCFKNTQVMFSAPASACGNTPNISLLLGNNCSGKTTILKGVALSIMSRVLMRSGFFPRNYVRLGGSEKVATLSAKLCLHHQDTQKEQDLQITLNSSIHKEGDTETLLSEELTGRDGYWNDVFFNDRPSFLVIGYGASRWVPTTQREIESRLMGLEPLPRYERVISLFDGHTGLVPLGAWLPRIANARYDEVIYLINALLPPGTHMTQEFKNHNYYFSQDGNEIPFSDLSDGYRGYIGWVADLAFHLQSVCPEDQKLTDLKGIVLIDEIDLHLHPSWQRNVLPSMSKSLPNLQFIISTHSPIVAGTVDSKNIIVFEKNELGGNHAVQLDESIQGLNAEQILLSSYFNLETTRAPRSSEHMAKLATQALMGEKKAAEDFMDFLIQGQNPT